MTGAFRPRAVVAESLRNIRANLLVSCGMMLLAFGVGIGVPAVALMEVASIRSDADAEIRAGSNVLRVLGEGRTPLSASRCEGLNGVPGVLAAGGLQRRESVIPVARPGDVITRMTGTPSLGRVLWPSLSAGGAHESVVAGSATADTFGLTTDANFAFTTRADPTPGVAVVGRIGERSDRDPQLDSAFFIATPPVGDIIECLVEAEPGARAAVESLARGWFASSGETAVTPYYLATTERTSPEQRWGSGAHSMYLSPRPRRSPSGQLSHGALGGQRSPCTGFSGCVEAVDS